MATADELRAVREAESRLRRYRAGEVGADVWPDDDEADPEWQWQETQDRLLTSDAYLDLRAACVRLVAAERALDRMYDAGAGWPENGPAAVKAREDRAAALRDIAGLVGEG